MKLAQPSLTLPVLALLAIGRGIMVAALEGLIAYDATLSQDTD
ncbi:hypothetical protein [Novosphingobium capsulatum]|nr:hypothetical protein [Novosphingobium capsulatum]WQD94941.1 hypothetical protein U0041_10580 [Novosphingobium capsulatum]